MNCRDKRGIFLGPANSRRKTLSDGRGRNNKNSCDVEQETEFFSFTLLRIGSRRRWATGIRAYKRALPFSGRSAALFPPPTTRREFKCHMDSVYNTVLTSSAGHLKLSDLFCAGTIAYNSTTKRAASYI